MERDSRNMSRKLKAIFFYISIPLKSSIVSPKVRCDNLQAADTRTPNLFCIQPVIVLRTDTSFEDIEFKILLNINKIK